jgi:hypothetical protein
VRSAWRVGETGSGCPQIDRPAVAQSGVALGKGDLGDIYVEGDSNLLEELRGCGGMYGSLSAYMAVPGEEPAYVIFGLSVCDYAGNLCDSPSGAGRKGGMNAHAYRGIHRSAMSAATASMPGRRSMRVVSKSFA